MYFTLLPDPGYNRTYLDSCGIEGEWDLFQGDLWARADISRLLIGRELQSVEIFSECCYASYAIKNQLNAPKAPMLAVSLWHKRADIATS